jgi:hypothetical protein
VFRRVRLIFNRPVGIVAEFMKEQLRTGLNPVPDLSVAPPVSPLVAGLKSALFQSTPVAVSVPVWFRSDGHLDAGWEMGPHVQMPSPALLEAWLAASAPLPAPPSGWHVIAVCGYDDRIARFEFKNSWDTWWGDNGFGTIPYDYIARYARTAMRGWA